MSRREACSGLAELLFSKKEGVQDREVEGLMPNEERLDLGL